MDRYRRSCVGLPALGLVTKTYPNDAIPPFRNFIITYLKVYVNNYFRLFIIFLITGGFTIMTTEHTNPSIYVIRLTIIALLCSHVLAFNIMLFIIGSLRDINEHRKYGEGFITGAR